MQRALRRIPPLAMGAVLALTAAYSQELSGQSILLDEGTFTLFIGGEEVGTETFEIRRNGNGPDATILASGIVTMEGPRGPTQMWPILRAAANREPLLYQNRLEGGEISEVVVTSRGRHFIAEIRSAEGDRERELRAQEGAVILDEWVAHHYFFVATRTEREGTIVPVVIPRTGRQLRFEVTSVAVVEFPMGREQIQSRRVRLVSGDDTRDVWFDEQGRVLQVDIPGLGYRAVRQGS